MKKIVLCFLTLICTLTLLAACGKTEPPADTSAATTAEDTTTDSGETAPQFSALTIGETPISEYTIIYGQSEFADNAVLYPEYYPVWDFNKETAERLAELIYTVSGVRLSVACDTETEEAEREILVGQTNRPQTDPRALRKLSEEAYTIWAADGKLMICGGSYGATWHALDYLEEQLTRALVSEKTYAFAEDLKHDGQFDPIRILCIGDSITQGVGVSDPANHAYPAQLERRLWKDALVVNLGVSGKTLRSDLTDSYRKTGSYKKARQLADEADIVTIMLGTNDGNRIGTGWSEPDSAIYKQDYETLLQSFSEMNPRLHYVIMNCPTTFRAPEQNFDSAEIRRLQAELVDELAAKGYTTSFFDMHTATADLEAYYPDQLHPDDRGHTIMAEKLAPALAEIIRGMGQ